MRSSRFGMSSVVREKMENSSLLSCEKDTEMIVEKIFIENQTVADEIKRLMVINTKDCLTNRTNQDYIDKINSMSVKKLRDEGYIRNAPKISMGENEPVKNYINITFDHFTPSKNGYHMDCVIMVDVISHTDYWDVGNFRVRPIKIAGYINSILDKCRLSGLGQLEFLGCNEIVLSEELSGYCLIYNAVHGNDDRIAEDEE